MSKAKNKFSAGPDNLPPIFLRNTSSTLSFPLAILFRSFFNLKNCLSEWKHSKITPKFKNGDPSVVSNYRPNMCLFQNLWIYFIKWITILPHETRSHHKTPTCFPEKTFHDHKPTRIPLWLDYLILKQKIRQCCLYRFLSCIRHNISPKNNSKTIGLRY